MTFKKYVLTTSGKIVKVNHIDKIDGEYIVWEDIYYSTISTFKEKVVATSDSAEELLAYENQLRRKRLHKYKK